VLVGEWILCYRFSLGQLGRPLGLGWVWVWKKAADRGVSEHRTIGVDESESESVHGETSPGCPGSESGNASVSVSESERSALVSWNAVVSGGSTNLHPIGFR
jgi:hypothetical protein